MGIENGITIVGWLILCFILMALMALVGGLALCLVNPAGSGNAESKKELLTGFFLSVFHNSSNDRVEIFFKPCLALLCIIPTPMCVAMGKPYRISWSKMFNEHLKAPNTNLIGVLASLCGHLHKPLYGIFYSNSNLVCVLLFNSGRGR